VTRPFSAAEAVAAFGDDPSRPDAWIFDRTLPDFAHLADTGPVSARDRERAGRLKARPAGAYLLARRAALRRVLALYLSRDPEDVRLITLPGGKPTLVPGPRDARRLSFSTAHSGDLFCLAVGSANSLGVDVEVERTVPRAIAIATRWFSDEEAEPLRAAASTDSAPEPGSPPEPGSAPEPGSEAFLRLWTAKEALAKRHSAGLRLLRRGRDELDVAGAVASRTLVHFVPRAGYVAAVASTTVIDDVRILSDARLD
jgi:phosphopantetheinyl transferase